MVKLKNIKTGDIIEKSDVNWQNLQKDLKANYIVLDGTDSTEGKGTLHFTPPEISKPADDANPETENKPESDAENKPLGAEETQEQQIVRLFKEKNPQTEDERKDALKAIAKVVGAHFKTVEKVVNNIQ